MLNLGAEEMKIDFEKSINVAMMCVTFQLVGMSQGCLDHTVPYLLERQQFGKQIFEFQVCLSVSVINTAVVICCYNIHT